MLFSLNRLIGLVHVHAHANTSWLFLLQCGYYRWYPGCWSFDLLYHTVLFINIKLSFQLLVYLKGYGCTVSSIWSFTWNPFSFPRPVNMSLYSFISRAISSLSSKLESEVATEITLGFSGVCQLNNDPPLPATTYMVSWGVLQFSVTILGSNFASIVSGVYDL